MNFAIDEVLYGTYEKNDEIQYTLDQLSSASIEITAESTDITDKKGNVVRKIWKSKSGSFTATNAFLHCQIMASQGGTDAEYATATDKIKMPKFVAVDAGNTADISDADLATLQVIGMYGNGASDTQMDKAAAAALVSGGVFSAPAGGEDKPVTYLVKYQRSVESGAKIVNDASVFPATGELTLQCSYVDPCKEDLGILYVVIPSFQPDPNMTVALDRENQTLDYKGTLQVDFCSGTAKVLYYIYVPETDEIIPVVPSN